MKNIMPAILIMLYLSYPSFSHATTFYIDPIKGNNSGDGSAINPWRTLEEVINAHLIETKDVSGTIINQGAPIKAGDKIILNSGYHGFIYLRNAFNDKYITVIAGLKQKPTLSGLTVLSAKNWRFSKLTISPVFSNTAISSANIVTIGESNFLGNTYNIALTDSHIYAFNERPETLSSTDWAVKAKTGMMLGRYAKNLQIINNYVNNIAFGINNMGQKTKVQANIVTDFSKDGIRASAGNMLITDNVVKNNYVVDGNHPDGIQGFSYDSKITLTNVIMSGNIILNRDKKGGLYSGILQGIGFFDGPIKAIQAKNNLIMSFTWHGIALYDSIKGQIIDNTIFTPAQIANVAARITLGTKNRGGNIDNMIMNNKAHIYIIENSLGLISSGNTEVAIGSGESVFMASLIARLSTLNTQYGKYHPVTGQTRVEESFISGGVASLF